MFNRQILIGLLAILLLMLGGQTMAQQTEPAHEATATLEPQTLMNGEIERSYYLYVPETINPAKPAPLVIALHTAGENARSLMMLSDLNTAADEKGFIVAYPNALELTWYVDESDNQLAVQLDDDVAYIDTLITTLRDQHAVGDVHLVGQGSGGLMAYKLACRHPDWFDSVVVVSALMWDIIYPECPEPDDQGVDLLIIHGQQDQWYPLEGVNRGELRVTGVPETMAFWADQLGCAMSDDAFPQVEGVPNLRMSSDCTTGATLAYYGVQTGANIWFRQQADHLLNQVGVNVTAIIADYVMDDPAWMVAQGEIIEDIPRSYRVYVPDSYDASQPAPLVMVLHGRPGSGSGIAYITDMNTVADEHGFIVVYPDAIDQGWNYTFDVPGFEKPRFEYSDFEFFRELLTDLSQTFNIDEQRRYVTGFSNGGFMTNRLACDMSDTFAAFAASGSGVFYMMDQICDGKPAIPMLLIHGTDDISIPWRGLGSYSIVTDEIIYNSYPVDGTLNFWARHNACTGEELEREVLPQSGLSPDTEVWVYTVPGCPTGAEIILYAIIGGGHNWAGVPDRISPQIAGTVNMDIHASEVVWDFFTGYTLDGEE